MDGPTEPPVPAGGGDLHGDWTLAPGP